MGINDDRLEVLTRRVLLDKNYKQTQGKHIPRSMNYSYFLNIKYNVINMYSTKKIF